MVFKPGDKNRAENRVKNVDVGPGPTALKGKARVQELRQKFEGGAVKKDVAAVTKGAAAGTATTKATTTAARPPLRTVSTRVTATSAVSEIAITRRTRSSSVQAQQQQQQRHVPAHVYLPRVSEHEEQPQQPQPRHRRQPLAPRADDAMMVDPVPVPSPRRFVAARQAVVSGLPISSSRNEARRRSAGSTKQRTPEDEDEEDGPAYKKRRTSSDVPDVDEAAVHMVPDEVEGLAKEVDPNGNEWDDLDVDDADDPLMVSEYVMDIFNYLKEVEVCFFLINSFL